MSAMPIDSTNPARELRHRSTDAERRLWSRLRAKRLDGWKFKRQHPIGPYIADFVCHAARLVVEVDGGQHSDSEHDLNRDAWLRSRGYAVLRFWNNDVLQRTDTVETAINDALNVRLTDPLPSPLP